MWNILHSVTMRLRNTRLHIIKSLVVRYLGLSTMTLLRAFNHLDVVKGFQPWLISVGINWIWVACTSNRSSRGHILTWRIGSLNLRAIVICYCWRKICRERIRRWRLLTFFFKRARALLVLRRKLKIEAWLEGWSWPYLSSAQRRSSQYQ